MISFSQMKRMQAWKRYAYRSSTITHFTIDHLAIQKCKRAVPIRNNVYGQIQFPQCTAMLKKERYHIILIIKVWTPQAHHHHPFVVVIDNRVLCSQTGMGGKSKW